MHQTTPLPTDQPAVVRLNDHNCKLAGKYFLYITESPKEPVPESKLKSTVFSIACNGRPNFNVKAYSMIRYDSIRDIPELYRLLAWGQLESPERFDLPNPCVYMYEKI